MLKLKNILLFFFVSTIVGTLARAFCLIYTTEAATGFLLHRMRGLGITLMAFLAALLVCLFIFSLFLKENAVFGGRPSIISGASSMVLGLALIIDMLRGFTAHHGMLWQFAAKSVFGVLSAAVFLLYGFKAFKDIRFKPILFSIPVIFIVFQTIEVFTAYASLAIITEHLFDLAVLCFLLIFFLYFAKSANGIEGKYKKFLIPTGLCSSLLCLVSFLSRTVTVLVGCSDRLHGENPLSVSVVFFGLFTLFCIYESCSTEQ